MARFLLAGHPNLAASLSLQWRVPQAARRASDLLAAERAEASHTDPGAVTLIVPRFHFRRT
jgi:hypothetical protein